MWTREKVFNFAIIRIQISFSKFQLPTLSVSACYQVRLLWVLLTHLIVFLISANKTIQEQSPGVFCKNDVDRNFIKFIGKRLCQSLISNKVAPLRPANFSKKEALAQVFSCEFCKICKNTFTVEHLWVTASNHTTLNQQ